MIVTRDGATVWLRLTQHQERELIGDLLTAFAADPDLWIRLAEDIDTDMAEPIREAAWQDVQNELGKDLRVPFVGGPAELEVVGNALIEQALYVRLVKDPYIERRWPILDAAP